MLAFVDHASVDDTLRPAFDQDRIRLRPASPLAGEDPSLGLPAWEAAFFRSYSAALATRAFSASSKASIRRAVAMGDFV